MRIAPKVQRMCSPCSGRFLCGLLFSSRIGKITLIDGENDAVLCEELKGIADDRTDHFHHGLVLVSVQYCGIGQCHQGGVFHCGSIFLFAVLEFFYGRNMAQLDCTGNEALHIGFAEHHRCPHHDSLVSSVHVVLTSHIFFSLSESLRSGTFIISRCFHKINLR